jgi:hypothetical protein
MPSTKSVSEKAVPHYRAYLVGHDDHYISVVDLDCADDEAALEAAKRLVDGHDFELWQGNRKVVRLEAPE